MSLNEVVDAALDVGINPHSVIGILQGALDLAADEDPADARALAVRLLTESTARRTGART